MYGHTYRLSIQYTLNGFSVYLKEVRGGAVVSEVVYCGAIGDEAVIADILTHNYCETVYVGCATDRVVLVPAELFEPDNAARYLEQRGFVVEQQASVMFNDSMSEGVVAVWENPYLLDVLDLVPSDAQVVYYHPLQLCLPNEPFTVTVDVTGGYMNIALRSNRLISAETYAVAGAADILFCLNKTIACNGNLMVKVLCSGDEAEDNCAWLSEYYRRVEVRMPLFGTL